MEGWRGVGVRGWGGRGGRPRTAVMTSMSIIEYTGLPLLHLLGPSEQVVTEGR